MKPSTYRAILAALAILGSLLVYAATSQFGPGLSTDGARYLSTAENIAAGRGVIDYYYEPLVHWPPLYPLLLAGLHLLSGANVFVIAWVGNILLFAVIIWLSGIFFARALPENYTLALLATLIVTFFLPFLEVSANVATDPLFMVFVLLWLLAAQEYLKTRSRNGWLQLAALGIVASLTRYAGIALVMSGALVVLLAWRPQWLQGLGRAATLGLASALPLAAWAILHNYRLTGLLLGSHRPPYPWGMFFVSIERVFSWFAPQRILLVVPSLVLLGLLIALLAAGSTRARWAAWVQRLLAAPLLPALIFSLVYGALLLFTASYSEHNSLEGQRLHAVLLPMLLAFTAATAQEFLPKLKHTRAWHILGLAAFALWLLFPLYRVSEYVLASHQRGDVSDYNIYNRSSLRQSDIVTHLQPMPLGPDDRIYSNNDAAAWFYLRRRIHRLPRYDGRTQASLQAALQDFEDWPAAGEPAFLVWFWQDLDYQDEIPRPEALRRVIRLHPVYYGNRVSVYAIEAE